MVAITAADVATAIAPEWVVCRANARDVVGGVVVCPFGPFSAWEHCLGCHFLEGGEGDRDPERSCSTEPVAAYSPPQVARTDAAWTELIIELL